MKLNHTPLQKQVILRVIVNGDAIPLLPKGTSHQGMPSSGSRPQGRTR